MDINGSANAAPHRPQEPSDEEIAASMSAFFPAIRRLRFEKLVKVPQSSQVPDLDVCGLFETPAKPSSKQPKRKHGSGRGGSASKRHAGHETTMCGSALEEQHPQADETAQFMNLFDVGEGYEECELLFEEAFEL